MDASLSNVHPEIRSGLHILRVLREASGGESGTSGACEEYEATLNALAEKLAALPSPADSANVVEILENLQALHCAALVATVRANAHRMMRAGIFSERVDVEELCQAIPGEHAGKAPVHGLSPTLAVVLGIVPPSHSESLLQFERGLSLAGKAKAEREISKVLEGQNGAENSATCWWLAIRSVASDSSLSRMEFLDQVRAVFEIADDSTTRLEAAKREWESMCISFSSTKALGADVPFGERRGCAEAALVQGHPFAVRFDASRNVYEVHELREETSASGVTACESLAELKNKLRQLRETYDAREVPAVARAATWRGRFWALMRREVQRLTPQLLEHFDSKAMGANYRADHEGLLRFCVAMGTMNPYLARSRAQWILPHDSEIPEHERVSGIKAFSASGQPILRDVYCARNPARSGTFTFFCSTVLATSLIREWPVKLGEDLEGLMSRHKRRVLSAVPAVDLTLIADEESVRHEPRQQTIDTAFLQRRKAYADELTNLIEERKSQIAELAREGNFVIPPDDLEASNLLAGRLGGKLWSRLEKRSQLAPEAGGLTAALKERYVALKLGFTHMPDEEFRETLEALLLDDAAHTLAKSSAAFAAFRQDLALLQSDAGLQERFANPARALIEYPQLGGSAPIVTPLAINDIMARFSVGDMREALNREYLAQSDKKRELFSALKLFEPLFLESDGAAWQEDARKSGIPRRVADTIAGCTLNRYELLQVKRALMLLTLCPTEKSFYCGVAIEDFRHMVDSVLLSAAKVRYAERIVDQLVREHNSRLPETEPKLDFHSPVSEIRAAAFGAVRARAEHRFPYEAFTRPKEAQIAPERWKSSEWSLLSQLKLDPATHVSPAEALDRALACGEWIDSSQEQQIRSGLFRTINRHAVRQLCKKMYPYQRVDTVSSVLADANVVLESFLVVRGPRLPTGYVATGALEQWRAIAALRSQIERDEAQVLSALGFNSAAQASALIRSYAPQQRGLYQSTQFFLGFVNDDNVLVAYDRNGFCGLPNSLVDSFDKDAAEARERRGCDELSGVTVMRRELLIKALQTARNSYNASEDLQKWRSWADDLQVTAQLIRERVLQDEQNRPYILKDWSWNSIIHLAPALDGRRTVFIARRFVDQVVPIMEAAKHRFPERFLPSDA